MKKKRLKRILSQVTYMQLSLILFLVSLLITAVLGIRAVARGGNLSFWEGLFGIAALLLSIAGFAAPLYGRFVVRAEAKQDYRIGLILNGVLMLLLFFFYFLGL